MSQFVHLRVHSQYSIGEGTLFVKNIPGLCKKYSMPAVALTDTNLMSGTAEFSDVCPLEGIQPIIGTILSLNHHSSADPKILRENQLSKIVLLAQDHDGYLNLCNLTKIMYMRENNWHLGPHITIEELSANSGGIICLSGGHSGPIGMTILNNQSPDLITQKFFEIFNDKFYIEIQRHGLDEEIKTEPEFLRLAEQMNIPIVATNDVCFSGPENYESEDALCCVLQQTKIIDPERTRKSSEQYFKTPDEMIETFSDLPEAIQNTIVIAHRCAFSVNVHENPLLPKFGTDFESECIMLREQTLDGLKVVLDQEKIPENERAPYFEQAEFELKTIIGMGFPGYFLIVADYIKWCNNNDIMTGPGRGSGAGSVVAWALGITKVNPLKYGLLFERFLNPDRISMPDFDIDFEPAGLEPVWDYIQNRYGKDTICRIITFGSLQARGAIRDIGRVYGIPYSKSDRLSKLIPMDAKNLKSAVDSSYEIQSILDADSDLRKSVSIATEIEGAYRNLGQHACGVVIGDRATTMVAPVYRDPNNAMPSCQFDGHYLEKVGLIKFDFLGLETLAVLKKTLHLIKQTHGVNINLDQIPLEDDKTLRTIWQSGKTDGVFQFDAPFVKQTLKKMRPSEFANMVALNALNRPGPIGFIPSYIARMHGEEPVSYPHARAEEVLKETYGIFVYQEQIMLLTRVLAGFTRGESDSVRKAMGKKIVKMMDELEVKFVEGCAREKTLNEDQARKIWGEFKEFAKYAFNKSHALCYTVVAQQCAYLKAHYPAEFLAASMSSNMNDSDQMALFMDDAKNNFGIEVVAPDINNSESLFIVRDGKIIFGLAAIKGVGQSATDQIISERNAHGKFKNLTDFAKRTAAFMNKRVLEAFIKVGVLDSFCKDRARLYLNADSILNYASKQKSDAGLLSLFANTVEDDSTDDRLLTNLAKVAPWTFGEKLENELSALGFYISAHPLDQYKHLITRTGLTTSITLSKKADRMPVQIAVNVNSFVRRRTKTGKDMITINASDSFGNIDAVAFGDSAADFAQILSKDSVVLISGKTSNRDDRVSIFVDSIIPLAQWVAGIAKKLTLEIHNQSVLPDIKKSLDTLAKGNTKVVLNIHGTGKSATIALPRSIQMTPSIANDLNALGVKSEIE